MGVQQPAPPGSPQLGPCCCPAAGTTREQSKKSHPTRQEIQRDVPNPPTALAQREGVRAPAWLEAAGSARHRGCATPRAALQSSVEEQLNNSTKFWARGSCRRYGTPGHRFRVEQPFLRGQIEVPCNISVVYAQATAHKSRVTTSCISTTSLPRIIFSSRVHRQPLTPAQHSTETLRQPSPRIKREASAAVACAAHAEPWRGTS